MPRSAQHDRIRLAADFRFGRDIDKHQYLVYHCDNMTTELHDETRRLPCCGFEDEHVLHAAGADELSGSAAVFKALSDETRLRILRAISHMK